MKAGSEPRHSGSDRGLLQARHGRSRKQTAGHSFMTGELATFNERGQI